VARDSFPPKPISEIKEVSLKKNEFNHLKYTVNGYFVTLEVNGETVETVELPSYPAMGTVATEDDGHVFVKIVNFADSAEPVEITLDCDVEENYTVGLLTGNATDENSIEKPENVHDMTLQASGASRVFTYEAPALSVNILTLTKKKGATIHGLQPKNLGAAMEPSGKGRTGKPPGDDLYRRYHPEGSYPAETAGTPGWGLHRV
jgi:hypothetical protein